MPEDRPALPTVARTWHLPSPVEQQARALRGSGGPVFDLAEAIPRVTSPHAADAPEMSADWGSYPDSRGLPELRARIAERENAKYGLRLTADHVVVTNGATEALALLVHAFVRPGEGVRMQSPGIFLYRDIVENNGAAAVPLGDRRFQGRAPLWLAHNPSNPDGGVRPREAIQTLVDQARAAGALLVLDQVYDELLYGASRPPEEQAWIDGGALVKVSSVSKSFGAPGLRVGWICCHPDLAEVVGGISERFRIAVSVLSQAHAVRLLAAPLDALAAQMAPRRRMVGEWLAGSTLFQPAEPEAGLFHWLALRSDGETASDLCDRALREQGVWLLPGSSFWGGTDRRVRLSFGSRPEVLAEGLARLSRVGLRP